jgi:hypothetical protein
LVELALHLLFDIAGSAADAFLYLAADIAGGAGYTVFVHRISWKCCAAR